MQNTEDMQFRRQEDLISGLADQRISGLMVKDMKKYIFTIVLALVALATSAQIKKPELMVFPSDNWCIQNGYYTEETVMGVVKKIPDYERAFQEALTFSRAGNVAHTVQLIFGYKEFNDEARKSVQETIDLMKIVWNAGNEYYKKNNLLGLE